MSERELFVAALHLTDPAARAAFLDQACGVDRPLRDRVVSLLAEYEKVGSFLEAPAAGPATPPATATFGTDPPSPTADYAGKDEHVGSVLAGKYKLVEEIGEGGMGSVFMARPTEPVKRAVAVKVVKAGMDSKAVLARFEAERQALAMMDQPNIARVLDAGTTEGGRPYFVMELVKGVPITEFCDARRLTPGSGWGCSWRCAGRCSTPTRRGSSTATSSRPTSSWRCTKASPSRRSSTTGWRRRPGNR